MFRRLSNTLPKDPEFPADLEKLGYTITPQDQIRSLAHPTQEFNFFISKNARVRDTQRESFNTCIRANLAARLAAAGLITVRLSGSHALPADTTAPHVPILTTANLGTADRVLLYVGESTQDLGVLAYRTIGQRSIASGTVLEFVAAARSQNGSPRARAGEAEGNGEGNVAIVIANPGQLLYHRRTHRAVTTTTWDALPRPTGVSGRPRVDPLRNRVVGHRDGDEHLGSVMAFLRREMKKGKEGKVGKKREGEEEGAKVEICAVGDGVEAVVGFLDRSWSGYWGKQGRVAGVCVGLGYRWRVGEEVGDSGFREFWGKRARAYLLHHTPLGTPLHGREEIGCNCYSSGEDANVECIMPAAYSSMFDFFQLVRNLPEYEEEPILLEPNEETSDRVVRWEDARGEGVVEGMQRELIGVSRVEGVGKR